MNDVTSCAIVGDLFTIQLTKGDPFMGWEVLDWPRKDRAIYTAGQAAAWCAESLDRARTEFIHWAAGVKVDATRAGHKPTAATAVMEHSDQYPEMQQRIARAERMRRISVALAEAVKFMTTENTNA